MQRILQFLLPVSHEVSTSEKIFSGIAAFIAMLLVGFIAFSIAGNQAAPYLGASLGAASILVFAMPHSPASQPWPILGGHLISSFIGVSSYLLIDNLIFASALAVSLSIIAMYYTRSLHPPGGAAALGAVLGGTDIHALGYLYIFIPIALNSVLIIIFGVLLNKLIPNRRYPSTTRRSSLNNVATEWALGPPRFKEQDLVAALQNMDSYIDISQEDLTRIYTLAVINANKRRLGEVFCQDIMSHNPVTFQFDTELETAWNTLQQKNIKAAPIVDSFNHPIGIVTTTDFMYYASRYTGNSFQERFRNFIKRTPGYNSNKPEVVGQIMSKSVDTANLNQHIVELIPTFTEKGFHHMPVVDDKGRIVGIITRADVMRSMLIVRT